MFFFFNDTATTEIYTLSLHDALPISGLAYMHRQRTQLRILESGVSAMRAAGEPWIESWRERQVLSGVRCYDLARSEEHTSELQSHLNLVCRLLLEKKKHLIPPTIHSY